MRRGYRCRGARGGWSRALRKTRGTVAAKSSSVKTFCEPVVFVFCLVPSTVVRKLFYTGTQRTVMCARPCAARVRSTVDDGNRYLNIVLLLFWKKNVRKARATTAEKRDARDSCTTLRHNVAIYKTRIITIETRASAEHSHGNFGKRHSLKTAEFSFGTFCPRVFRLSRSLFAISRWCIVARRFLDFATTA